MADVFISYSRRDEPLARLLADKLAKLGFDVWWDHMLVGGANFRQKILAELKAARAAIVIWSPESVLSSWVLGEAEIARVAKKLVPTRSDALPTHDIPLGFGDLHTSLVTDVDVVLAALSAMQVTPSKPPVVEEPVVVPVAPSLSGPALENEQITDWTRIKSSTKPADFRRHIKLFPGSHFLELATSRLAELERAAWDAARSQPAPARLRAFIAEFKGGLYEAEARRLMLQLEDQAWDLTQKHDSESLVAFLRDYPDGHYSREARDLIGMLREEEAEAEAWALASANPTKEKLETFLKQFPIGAHYTEAKDLLTALLMTGKRAARWREIKDAAGIEQLKKFIDEFKIGAEVEEAKRQLRDRLRARETKVWGEIKDALTPAPFLAFLRDHPEGVLQKEAIGALRQLPAKVAGLAWAEIKDLKRADLIRLFLDVTPEGRHAEEARKVLARLGAEVPERPSGRPMTWNSSMGSLAPSVRRKWLVGIPYALLLVATLVFSVIAIDNARSFNARGVADFVLAAGVCVTLAALLQYATGLALNTFVARDDRFGRMRAHIAGALVILAWIIGLLLAAAEIYGLSSSSGSYRHNALAPGNSNSMAAAVGGIAAIFFGLTFGLARGLTWAYVATLAIYVGGISLAGTVIYQQCLLRSCLPPNNYYLNEALAGVGWASIAIYGGLALVMECLAGLGQREQSSEQTVGIWARTFYVLLICATAGCCVLWMQIGGREWSAAGLSMIAATLTAAWHYHCGYGLVGWQSGRHDVAERSSSHAAAMALMLLWTVGLYLAASMLRLSQLNSQQSTLLFSMAAIFLIFSYALRHGGGRVTFLLYAAWAVFSAAWPFVLGSQTGLWCAAFVCQPPRNSIFALLPMGLAALTALWALKETVHAVRGE